MERREDVRKLLPKCYTVRELAVALDLNPMYLGGVLGGWVKPGAELTVKICSLCPKIKKWQLRPDLFGRGREA